MIIGKDKDIDFKGIEESIDNSIEKRIEKHKRKCNLIPLFLAPYTYLEPALF